MVTPFCFIFVFYHFTGVFESSFLPRIHPLIAAFRRSVHVSFGNVHGRADGEDRYSGDSAGETRLDLPLYLFTSLIILSVFSSRVSFLGSTR